MIVAYVVYYNKAKLNYSSKETASHSYPYASSLAARIAIDMFIQSF